MKSSNPWNEACNCARLLATLQGSDGFGALPKLCDASDAVGADGTTICEKIRPCLEGILAANDPAGGASFLLALPFLQGVSAPEDILTVAGSDLCALKVLVELLQRVLADSPEFAPAWGTANELFTESLGWTIAEVNDFALNIANLVAPCAGADSSMCRGFMRLPYVPGPLNCAASAGPNEDLMLCARGYAAHHWLPAGQNLSPLVLCDPTGAHGCAPLWTCCPKDDPSDVCDVCPGSPLQQSVGACAETRCRMVSWGSRCTPPAPSASSRAKKTTRTPRPSARKLAGSGVPSRATTSPQTHNSRVRPGSQHTRPGSQPRRATTRVASANGMYP